MKRASEPSPPAARENSKREIVIPHEAQPRPVSAVKSVLIQASFTQLQQHGHFERYQKLVGQETLEQLRAQALVPCWVSIELMTLHYAACEAMELSPEELNKLASKVGDKLQETTLVSSAKKSRDADFDFWSMMGPLHRVWGRLYQGGSVQIVKLGPTEAQIEMLGFTLNRFRYFRNGQPTAIAVAYEAVGARIKSARNVSYSQARDELHVRLSWE